MGAFTGADWRDGEMMVLQRIEEKIDRLLERSYP